MVCFRTPSILQRSAAKTYRPGATSVFVASMAAATAGTSSFFSTAFMLRIQSTSGCVTSTTSGRSLPGFGMLGSNVTRVFPPSIRVCRAGRSCSINKASSSRARALSSMRNSPEELRSYSMDEPGYPSCKKSVVYLRRSSGRTYRPAA